MDKRDWLPILKEKWEIIDEETIDPHHIRVKGEEFFAFPGSGGLLFTPEEVAIARRRFKEWPNHTVIHPLWTLDKDDIRESAARLGIQIEESDFEQVVKSMRARIADTIGDAWDETLDEEVEFVVNNRIAKKGGKQ